MSISNLQMAVRMTLLHNMTSSVDHSLYLNQNKDEQTNTQIDIIQDKSKILEINDEMQELEEEKDCEEEEEQK